MFALCCTNVCQRIFTKSNVTTWHLYGSGITYLLHGNETKRSVIKLSRGVNLHLLNVRRSLPWLTAFIMDVPSRLCLPQAGGTHSSLRSTKRNFRQTKCSCISFIVLFSFFCLFWHHIEDSFTEKLSRFRVFGCLLRLLNQRLKIKN